MIRETFKVPEDDLGDFTNKGPWEIKGETYVFIDDYPTRDCDGECHNVIIKRESDQKYFKFTWQYYRDNYYYEDEFVEVFPETVTKTTYK